MIAVIRYNAGNIRSVQNALLRLGYESRVTDDPGEIIRSDKVIFPGVGEAGSSMKYLRSRGLDKLIKSLKQPVLGICLGLQLMCRKSEESDTSCLGIFDADVKRLPSTGIIPHMGWNDFVSVSGDLLIGVSEKDDMYYVHSYYAEISPFTTAVCEYLVTFSSAMQKDNFYGTQFHPEKSAGKGELILKNFLEL